jgi:EmrB/QacA subfamily drug resistance transporter
MTHAGYHGAPNGGDPRAPAGAPDASGGFTHRQVMTILVGLLLGMFLASLDQTVVSTAIRTVADDLNGYDLQAWATTAFLITSTIANPLYGKLSDLYGRRPFYLFAIGVFLVGSMLCGLATSMYQLAAFRAVQGIGAGGLMSLAMVIVGDIVPPRERSKYQGYFMAVFGTSSVLGPVIGGALSGQESILGITGWRWIFYVNVPIGLIAFVTVMKVLHLPHTRREHRIDFPGALALITCLVPLLLVAEQGRTWGWGSGRALLCYAVGAVGLVAFVLAERVYKDDALLPLRMFGNRTFTVTSMGSIAVGVGMFGGILLLPQYLQIVHGSSPTLAGLQMIPLVLGIMTASIIAGQTIARTGKYRPFPLVGAVFIVAALVSMSFIVSGDTHWGTLAPFMVLLGLGLGFNFQPIILAVQNAVSPREIGVATSSVTFFRQMGGTIGTAAFLSILFSSLNGKIADAYADARGTAAFQQAAAAHTDQLKTLQNVGGGNTGGSFGDTSFIQRLHPALAAPFKTGFAHSIDLVFLVAACVVALGFVVLLFLPQLPLRNLSGMQAAAQQAAAGRPPGAVPSRDTARAAGTAAPKSASLASTQPAGAGTRGNPNGIPEPASVPGAAPRGTQLPGAVKRAPAGATGLRIGRTRSSRAAIGLGVGATALVVAGFTPDLDTAQPSGEDSPVAIATGSSAPAARTAAPSAAAQTTISLADPGPTTAGGLIAPPPEGAGAPATTTAPTWASASSADSASSSLSSAGASEPLSSAAEPSAAASSGPALTLVPSSTAPTSAAPTSAAPTSAAPTSAAPTSAAPTSAAPTSAAPTSAAPTSAAPTSAAPTSAAPTSAAVVPPRSWRTSYAASRLRAAVS